MFRLSSSSSFFSFLSIEPAKLSCFHAYQLLSTQLFEDSQLGKLPSAAFAAQREKENEHVDENNSKKRNEVKTAKSMNEQSASTVAQ